MTIDIERLKVDREYWDEQAPGGAEFYAPKADILAPGWYKLDSGRQFFMRENGNKWQKTIISIPGERAAIPRPEPKQQWEGSGLPPVGQRIEIQSPEDGSWSAAGEVTEIRTFVYTTSMRAGFNSTCNFRAARTKEQQLSDDLYALIYDRLPMIEAAKLRDEILERYKLEPK